MAHDLESQNGKASFASFREPAWHGLGTVFTEEKNTTERRDAPCGINAMLRMTNKQ